MIDPDNLLRRFEGISLPELDAVDLSDRQDYKSVFSNRLLPEFLEKLPPYYRILDMDGRRSFQYESVYYDTSELNSYQDHQRKKKRRHKFRFRRYVDCGDSFFEIKTRTGKGRNLKTRIPANENFMRLTAGIKESIRQLGIADPDHLIPSLRVTVTRITLLHKENTEKVTFDYNIRFMLNEKSRHLKNLVIAEVKQMRHDSTSKFFKIQRKLGIYPVAFSKYCMGIATLNEEVKTNNFKQSLLRIRKITADL